MNPGFLPGMMVALPFLAAALIRMPGIARLRLLADLISLAAAGGTAVLAGLACLHGLDTPLVQWIGGWEPLPDQTVGIALVADGSAAGFVCLAALLTTAALFFIARWYEAGAFLNTLTQIFLGGLTGFVLAGDLITMFVFLELMGIASYLLTAFKVGDDAPMQAAFNIAVVSTIGASFFLMGTAMIYAATATPNLAEAGYRLAEVPVTPALSVAFALLLIGLGIKSSLVLFHFAQVDSDSVAPAPHAGLFGALHIQAGIYGIARLSSVLFDAPSLDIEALRGLLLAAGLATALVAAMMSMVQNHLKRLLAFSSVAHGGIMAVGVALLQPQGFAGTGHYILGHAFVKMALFLTAGLLLHRFGSMQLGKLAGRGRDASFWVLLLALGALAQAGVPPFGMYGGKVQIGQAASELGMGWVMLPLYLASILTGAAVLRAVVRLFTPPSTEKAEPVTVWEGTRETASQSAAGPRSAIPVVLLGLAIAMPFIPGFAEGINETLARDFNPDRYQQAVLGGQPPPAPLLGEPGLWKAADLVKGLASGLAALVITAAFGRGGARSRGYGSMGWLRRFHSGHTGEYVSWSMAGAAGVAVWLIWQL